MFGASATPGTLTAEVRSLFNDYMSGIQYTPWERYGD